MGSHLKIDINGSEQILKPEVLESSLVSGIYQSIATCFDAYCDCSGRGHTRAGTFSMLANLSWLWDCGRG